MIKIQCSQVSIDSVNSSCFSIEIDKIQSIEGEIDILLDSYDYKDIVKSKNVLESIEYMDGDTVLKNVDNGDIIDYVLNNKQLLLDILESTDESLIITQARKLKIGNLLHDKE